MCRKSFKELEDIVEVLAGFFPVFVRERHLPHRPLKLQIDRDLAERFPALGRDERNTVLKHYCCRIVYLESCREGEPRFDLDGNVAGHVSAEHAACSKGSLTNFLARLDAKRIAAKAARIAEREARRAATAPPSPLAATPISTPAPTSPTRQVKRPLLRLPTSEEVTEIRRAAGVRQSRPSPSAGRRFTRAKTGDTAPSMRLGNRPVHDPAPDAERLHDGGVA